MARSFTFKALCNNNSINNFTLFQFVEEHGDGLLPNDLVPDGDPVG